MITLEMSPEAAVSLLHLICEEEKLYGKEFVPSRITALRELLPQIDEKLSEHFKPENNEED